MERFMIYSLIWSLIIVNCLEVYGQYEIYNGDHGMTIAMTMADEKRLIKDLLENYERVGVDGRPVRNSSETMIVNMGVSLIKITEVNEKDEYIEVLAWVKYMWYDILLKWDPSNFGGVKQLGVPVKNIWHPDIILYNGLNEFYLNEDKVMAVVESDGRVFYRPMIRLKAICPMDLINFPADIHSCVFKFRSQAYHGYKLYIDFYEGKDRIDISDYIEHNSWKISTQRAYENVKYYQCCKEPWPDMAFGLTIKRVNSYLNMWLVRPFMMLSIVLPFVFCLSGYTKPISAIGILIAFCLLLLMVQNDIPGTGAEIPLLVYYYTSLLCMSALAVILTILTTRLSNNRRYGKVMPTTIKKKMVNGLGKVLCVRSSPYTMTTHDPEHGASDKTMTESMLGPEDNTRQDDWGLLTMVLDRIFFILFAVVMFVFFIAAVAKYEMD